MHIEYHTKIKNFATTVKKHVMMLIIEMITILIMIAMIKYLIPKNFMKMVKFMMLIMIKMIKNLMP